MKFSISSVTFTFLAGSLVSLAAPAAPAAGTRIVQSLGSVPAAATPIAQYNAIRGLQYETNGHGSLTKRDPDTFAGLATHNATWPGACGYQRNDADFVVALNSPLWNNGANCFRNITIEANGKAASAMIVDECPGCPYGGLDLSPSLFQELTSLSVDIINLHYYGLD